MDIDFCGFDDVHLLGEGATHLPAPCSPRHAALQILAIATAIAAVCALPGTPITALASAFNCGFQVEGSDGAMLDPRVPMPQTVPVFAKSRPSAFSNPDLHPYLQGQAVSRLYIVGVFAEGCVRATAMAARALGYDVVVPLDAIASNAAWKLRFAVWSMRNHGVRISNTLT